MLHIVNTLVINHCVCLFFKGLSLLFGQQGRHLAPGTDCFPSWLCGSAVERRSLAGELSLSCARPVADGWPLMWVSHPLYVNQPGQLSLSSLWGSIKLQLDVCCLSYGGAIWWTLTKERRAWCCLQVKLCDPCLSALRVCVRTKMVLYKYSSSLPFQMACF